jgi:hypothetical protein
MPVKFKIGFEMDAETLFGIIAKFVPLENLSVEEVVERPHVVPRIAPEPNTSEGRPKPLKLVRASRNGRKPYTRHPRQIDLKTGLNFIILDALSDGENHTPTELKAAIAKTAYSPNSLASRMAQLIRDGHVVQADYGSYKLGKIP